jgi:hypothetical protein
MKDESFIGRWSRKKLAAKAAPAAGTAAPAGGVVPAQATPAAGRDVPTAGVVPAPAGTQSQPLPPVESLTPESDFAPFMGSGVDAGVKRQALKALFSDPRFNVMDGLDVYIDDYSKPDPLPEGWLEKLNQVARLGDYQPPAEAPAPPETAEKLPEPAPTEAAAEPPPADTPGDGNTPSKVG